MEGRVNFRESINKPSSFLTRAILRSARCRSLHDPRGTGRRRRRAREDHAGRYTWPRRRDWWLEMEAKFWKFQRGCSMIHGNSS